jgi:hypothetical protein
MGERPSLLAELFWFCASHTLIKNPVYNLSLLARNMPAHKMVGYAWLPVMNVVLG